MKDQRAFLLHYARVMIADARYRRLNRPSQRGFIASQLSSAAKARREASQVITAPTQMELFA